MSRGIRRPPFRYIQPVFFGGLLDDPVLYLRIIPLRRALLFDCGQIAHLAKRVVKPVDTVFITHAHMDHIMGIPTLVRHHHASPRPMEIFGPAGIGDRIHHLLQGFDWNLTEATWFTILVHEVHPDRISSFRFPGPEGFRRYFDGDKPRTGREIWSCRYLTVEAEILDHKLPSLSFRVTERPNFAIDPEKLACQGLVPGEWIAELKNRVWKGRSETRVMVTYRDGDGGTRREATDPLALYEAIRSRQKQASIGYLCDAGWTPENIAKIESFLGDLTLLYVECTFLAEDVAKARASHHLASSDLNELAAGLVPRYLLPMHLSKSYLRRTMDLYTELQPPSGTTIIPLPNHLVPAPVTVEQVSRRLWPASIDKT